jgi:GT2 family glycosyltransferase
VVILAWNNYPDVAECLESVTRSTYPLEEIIVLDNGSTDGSPDKVENAFPQVRVVRVMPNAGYASGANRGLSEALTRNPDLILFLASDTVAAPGMIEQLVATAKASSGVGILGPRIMHYDTPQVLQHGAGYIDKKGWAIHRDQTSITECEWVTGCGFMIRTEALRALREPQGFDERFFAYWEDVDFSHRIAATGFQVMYEPSAQLLHKESAATQAAESLTKKRSRNFYTIRNQFLFAQRHGPRKRRALRVARALAYEMPRNVASWIKHQGMSRDVLLVVRAYVDGILGRGGRAGYPGLY